MLPGCLGGGCAALIHPTVTAAPSSLPCHTGGTVTLPWRGLFGSASAAADCATFTAFPTPFLTSCRRYIDRQPQDRHPLPTGSKGKYGLPS
jgi:hypothetical protein